MQPEERDLAYLWDILDAARTAIEFTHDVKFQQYAMDRKLQLAVERLVEIIGEAARRVSEPFRDAHSEIPWRKIVAQRHVLAHDYGEIQQERLWVLVKEHLPALVAQLDGLVPSSP
jgi:uncharacterized protein with HEPN domain